MTFPTWVILAFWGAVMAVWALFLRRQHRSRRCDEAEALHFAEWERQVADSEEEMWP